VSYGCALLLRTCLGKRAFFASKILLSGAWMVCLLDRSPQGLSLPRIEVEIGHPGTLGHQCSPMSEMKDLRYRTGIRGC
jgi:hypothetical protein